MAKNNLLKIFVLDTLCVMGKEFWLNGNGKYFFFLFDVNYFMTASVPKCFDCRCSDGTSCFFHFMYVSNTVDSKLTLSILKYLQTLWKKYISDSFDLPYDLRSLLGLPASHFIAFPVAWRLKLFLFFTSKSWVSYGWKQRLRPWMWAPTNCAI